MTSFPTKQIQFISHFFSKPLFIIILQLHLPNLLFLTLPLKTDDTNGFCIVQDESFRPPSSRLRFRDRWTIAHTCYWSSYRFSNLLPGSFLPLLEFWSLTLFVHNFWEISISLKAFQGVKRWCVCFDRRVFSKYGSSHGFWFQKGRWNSTLHKPRKECRSRRPCLRPSIPCKHRQNHSGLGSQALEVNTENWEENINIFLQSHTSMQPSCPRSRQRCIRPAKIDLQIVDFKAFFFFLSIYMIVFILLLASYCHLYVSSSKHLLLLGDNKLKVAKHS